MEKEGGGGRDCGFPIFNLITMEFLLRRKEGKEEIEAVFFSCGFVHHQAGRRSRNVSSEPTERNGWSTLQNERIRGRTYCVPWIFFW